MRGELIKKLWRAGRADFAKLLFGFAIGAIAQPAMACMIEPLPSARVFDSEPTELDQFTKVARFEVLKIEDGTMLVRLKSTLFGRPSGDRLELIAPRSSCTINDERWGDDFGGVSRYRDENGAIRFVLRAFEYVEAGFPFRTRRAKGAPLSEHLFLGEEVRWIP